LVIHGLEKDCYAAISSSNKSIEYALIQAHTGVARNEVPLGQPGELDKSIRIQGILLGYQHFSSRTDQIDW
jgi:hypothetical protein